jgi:methionine-R-sulfoxide reductase
MSDQTVKNDAQPKQDLRDDALWRDKLSVEEYRICREKGTERPFTGEYWDNQRDGDYLCRCCGEPLFSSASKFDAGCGWPSFSEAAVAENVEEQRDISHGMIRTEVMCGHCGCHLGHVFPDGPTETGLRYCVNSASVTFIEKK